MNASPPGAQRSMRPWSTFQSTSVPSASDAAGSRTAGRAWCTAQKVPMARVASASSHSGTGVRRPTRRFHTSAAAATSGPSVHSRAGSAGSSAATTARRTSTSSALSSLRAYLASAALTPRAVRSSADRKWCSQLSMFGRPASSSRAAVPETPVRRANSSAASGRSGTGPRSAASVRNAVSQPGPRSRSPRGAWPRTVYGPGTAKAPVGSYSRAPNSCPSGTAAQCSVRARTAPPPSGSRLRWPAGRPMPSGVRRWGWSRWTRTRRQRSAEPCAEARPSASTWPSTVHSAARSSSVVPGATAR